MACRPSVLETTLAHEDLRFVTVFFDTWDPATIFLLGQLNYRLRSLVYGYVRTAWNVNKFLRNWFPRPVDVLKFLGDAPAIICGSSVLQFFDRAYPSATRIDMCVDFGGFVDVGRLLMKQEYEYFPCGPTVVKDFDLVALFESASYPEGRFKLHGERTVTQEEHGGRAFTFRRQLSASSQRFVVVHLVLVRTSSFRRVFKSVLAAFMNYITADYAVSVFPRSTFSNRRSFVTCQERFPGVDDAMTQADMWLREYRRGGHGEFDVVAAAHTVYLDAHSGDRWIGDASCWIIPCSTNNYDPLQSRSAVYGPAFDVLDWRAGVTRHGSYMRIAEPFVWRLPVEEKPLSLGVIKGLSASAKTAKGAKRFWSFPTSSDEPDALWVAPRSHGFSFKDFDLSHIFPNGCVSVCIQKVPGTDMDLPADWRIYIDSGRFVAPLNKCVKKKFGIDWPGNIVLVKHRRKSEEHIVNISCGEEDYAYVLLGLLSSWLKQFIHVKQSMGVTLHFKHLGSSDVPS
ncbi:hypothetical protein B0H11DRAFT_2229303 [Mycena galericulata]|nr:hypothetical protein B0H11DRAFT_2229303 [Mycena galericulata]